MSVCSKFHRSFPLPNVPSRKSWHPSRCVTGLEIPRDLVNWGMCCNGGCWRRSYLNTTATSPLKYSQESESDIAGCWISWNWAVHVSLNRRSGFLRDYRSASGWKFNNKTATIEPSSLPQLKSSSTRTSHCHHLHGRAWSMQLVCRNALPN